MVRQDQNGGIPHFGSGPQFFLLKIKVKECTDKILWKLMPFWSENSQQSSTKTT